MNFLKPLKNKIKLFLFMILIAIALSLLLLLLNRFVIENCYFNNREIYKLYWFVVSFLRYFIIAYLSIAFIKKKYSIIGEYYNIFKVVLLLFAFSVFHKALFSFVYSIIPEDIFILSWAQAVIAAPNLIAYYIVACFIYYLYNNSKTV